MQGVYEKRGGGSKGCLFEGTLYIKNFVIMGALN